MTEKELTELNSKLSLGVVTFVEGYDIPFYKYDFQSGDQEDMDGALDDAKAELDRAGYAFKYASQIPFIEHNCVSGIIERWTR